jgi:hypothetical protein
MDSINPQENSGEENRQPPVNPSVQPDIQPAPEHPRETEHCRPDQTPIGKYILEVLAAAVLAAYTIAAYMQLGVMSGQPGQMQSASNQTNQMLCLVRQQLTELHNQTTDTHNLALAAADQASTAKATAAATESLVARSKEAIVASQTAAQNALNASIEASRLDQRAWVGISMQEMAAHATPGQFSLTIDGIELPET